MIPTLERDLVEATGRLAVYSLLATGFAWPTEERLSVLRSRLLPAVATLEIPGPLGGAVRAVTSSAPADLDGMRRHHVLLFPPIASQDAPAYETGYRGDGIFQQSAMMADVAGFYRAHGLRAGGSERERPDHLVVELEFMATLARKEALALSEDSPEHVAVCRDTAATFLADHLGCWAPAFGRRAVAVATDDWYRGLGRLVAEWVEHDMSAFGVSPAETASEPLAQEPPDDGMCGPCPVPGDLG